MATSSILGGERAAERADGRDVDLLGPSDSTDSGSDVQHERRMPTEADTPDELGAVPSPHDSTSDSGGTGERAGATGDDIVDGADIRPDRIISGKPRRIGDDEIDDLAAEIDNAAVEDAPDDEGDVE